MQSLTLFQANFTDDVVVLATLNPFTASTFPGDGVGLLKFETAVDNFLVAASTFDLDVDIKISVDGNSAINQNGIPYNAPISFKVPKKQAQEAREIVKLVKKHYLCR